MSALTLAGEQRDTTDEVETLEPKDGYTPLVYFSRGELHLHSNRSLHCESVSANLFVFRLNYKVKHCTLSRLCIPNERHTPSDNGTLEQGQTQIQ